MYKIVLTGGGTGGHIIPNLALVPCLKKYFDQIHYIGSNGIEKELVAKENLFFHATDAIKLDRSHFMKNFKIPFVLMKSIREAKIILQKIQPSVIFSKGGYVSLPTCFAAKQLNIPIVIHESDMSLGLANRVVARFASLVITSFEETKEGEYIGNPVREEIFSGSKERAIKNYNIKNDKPVILIVGGSSGSTAINEVVYQSLPKLTQKYNVIHISGKLGDFNKKHSGYTQIEYAYDINDLYALADIVVSRAGANALSELAALGKRTLAIPLPKGSSRGDQIENALSYKKKGFLAILEQSNLNAETLIEHINSLYILPMPVIKNKENVNQRIVNRILEVIKSK